MARGLTLDKADPSSMQLLGLACGAGHAAVAEWMLKQGVGEGGAGARRGGTERRASTHCVLCARAFVGSRMLRHQGGC